jgi:iron complex outermembrane receptor protein
MNNSTKHGPAVCCARWFGLIVTIMVSLFLSPNLQAQDSGRVTGQVINAATRSSLEGARVTVSGRSGEWFTARDGSFQISGLGAGAQVLTISYTGLDPQTVTVNVGDEPSRVMVELTSDVYELDRFVVAGEREGSAAAITAQRNADNVKSVVATDSFGNIADGNLGEMLKRVSGIATNINEGEVDQIFVRGMGAAFSSVTMDGNKLPSPGKGKKTRNFEIDKLPADYIESIEVIKAPTPDMDADSIGGAVNMITKSGFSVKGRRVSYNFGMTHKTLKSKNSFFGGLQYSDVLGDDQKLGIFMSLSYSDNWVPQDTTQLDFQTTPAAVPYATRFRLEDSLHSRNRSGLGLKFDYKWSDETVLTASLMLSRYEEDVDQKRFSVTSRSNVADYVPGYTENRWEHVNAEWSYEMTRIEPKQESYVLKLGAKHDRGDHKVDYSVFFAPSTASEYRQDFFIDLPGQRVVVDRSASAWYPTYTNISPGDPSDFNRYRNARLTTNWGDSDETVWGGEFNYLKEFSWNVPFSLKVGGRYRGQELEVDNQSIVSNYVGADGVMGGDDNLSQFRMDKIEHQIFGGRYPQLQWADVGKASASFANSRNLWDDDLVTSARNSVSSDGKVTEEIFATYAMGTFDIGKLRLMTGVRMEHTKVKAVGMLNRPIVPALPSTAPEADRAQQVLAGYQKTTAKSDYTNYFPGVHFRYEASKSLMLRASYTTSIARSPFGELMPDTTINETNRTYSVNNTGLRPQQADNYDLSAEYYFEPSGYLSVGFFYKTIDDYIFTDSYVIGAGPNNGFNGQFEDYTFSSKKNGGQSKVKGVEFSYNQQLRFLPAWAQGFSAYASYTFIESEGNYNSQGATSDDQLVQFVPNVWNLGLTYERFGWTVRAQVNFNDRYLNAYAVQEAQRVYDDSRMDGSLSVKYQFSKRFGLFCDWTNALDETVVRVQGKDVYRPQKVRYNGMRINLGVSGTF